MLGEMLRPKITEMSFPNFFGSIAVMNPVMYPSSMSLRTRLPTVTEETPISRPILRKDLRASLLRCVRILLSIESIPTEESILGRALFLASIVKIFGVLSLKMLSQL